MREEWEMKFPDSMSLLLIGSCSSEFKEKPLCSNLIQKWRFNTLKL